MSNPNTFITVNIHADTPMDLNVGEHSALLTLGEAENVTLEFQSVEALERLQQRINTGLVTMHAQRPADAGADDEPAGGAR